MQLLTPHEPHAIRRLRLCGEDAVGCSFTERNGDKKAFQGELSWNGSDALRVGDRQCRGSALKLPSRYLSASIILSLHSCREAGSLGTGIKLKGMTCVCSQH